jgi:hypothetical protein
MCCCGACLHLTLTQSLIRWLYFENRATRSICDCFSDCENFHFFPTSPVREALKSKEYPTLVGFHYSAK